jgi:hypothetical protein
MEGIMEPSLLRHRMVNVLEMVGMGFMVCRRLMWMVWGTRMILWRLRNRRMDLRRFGCETKSREELLVGEDNICLE